jgi:hypothetical protein
MPYRFKKEYRDATIYIPVLRLEINRFNLTSEMAEKILKKYPKFSHNIEWTDQVEEHEEENQEEDIDAIGDSVDLDGEDAQRIDQSEFVTDKPRVVKADEKQDIHTGKPVKKTASRSNKTKGTSSKKKH